MKLKMRNKRLKLFAVVLLAFCITGLWAQESVNVSGGDVSGVSGSVSYSIGQVVYTANTSINGSVTQGVQQVFEISEVSANDHVYGIKLSVSVYPNPTNDYLTLDINDFKTSNMSYQLYDIDGKLLETKKIEGNQTNIIMNNLIPATYFVKITNNDSEIKIIKIIKH